jgi:lysophospholipase L1-like esterase/dienelactone hydrolase
MYRRVIASLSILFIFAPFASTQPKPPDKPADLPKIVLIGDSIRMGYAPLVTKRLEGKAVVVSNKANGGDTANVLKHLDEWVIREKPDIVHINAGLHDLKLDKSKKTYQVELEQYEKNLKEIVARIRKETKATIIFADTTPIHDERHAKRGGDFDRKEADVERYNKAALAVMKAEGITVHDLHGLVMQHGMETMLGNDGTHYTPAGYEVLAEAVADVIQRQLIVAAAKPLVKIEPDPKAGAAYRKAEAERDAQVPAVYKKLQVGALPMPESAKEWKGQRPEILKTVVDSLGDLPPRPSPLKVRLVAREFHPDYTLEHVAYDNGVDSEIGALLLIPEKVKKPAPAILWLHSSTPNKAQIVTPNTNGGEEPLGETFVHAGYVVMAPDAYWYGERSGLGPGGSTERDRVQEDTLHKFNLWMGRTLWGMFVRDDQIALDYLCSRPEVDKTRIGATGMSMGSTRSWWLAAVDDRVAATVGVACLTRYQNLIAHGQLRQHGTYYFNYGMLKHFDSEGVIMLIAPRPYLALTGDLDAGSPADGIKIIEQKAGAVYKTLGAEDKFKSILYEDIGHAYTPQMRKEMLAWFAKWLKPESP